MKCFNCGAEVQGKFCQYCGSELTQKISSDNNIMDNDYDNHTSQEYVETQDNVGKCPKCGGDKVKFLREKTVTETQAHLRKTGKQGESVKQYAYRTVGICQNCGFTWDPNATDNGAEKKKGFNAKIILWILGWIYIFPVPLTILLLRKKQMKSVVKYGIIAVVWVVFLIFMIAAVCGDSDTTTSPENPTPIVEGSEEPAQQDVLEEEAISTEEVPDESVFSFTIVGGEEGEYGELITFNQGTEFEDTFYGYYVPVGTYIVTNVGKYKAQITIYSEERTITEEGWEEPVSGSATLVEVGESATIVIEDGQYIKVHESENLEFIRQ